MKGETLISQETFVLFLFFHLRVEKRSTSGQVFMTSSLSGFDTIETNRRMVDNLELMRE